MRDILVTVLVFGGLPLIFLRPHIGIYYWSWIAFMNPHRLGYGFAFSFPFAALIGGALLVSFVFNSKERRPIPWNPITVTLVIWVIWMNITTLFALEPEAAAWQWNKVMKIQFMNFVMMMLIYGRERIIPFLWVMCLSIGYFGLKGGMFTVLTGGGGRVWGPPDSDLYDTNDLALGLLVIIPLFVYIRGQAKKKWAKHIATIFIVFSAFSVVGSYSRGAMVAGLMLLFFYWLNSKHKVLMIAPLILIVPIVTAFMPQAYFDRMNTVKEADKDESAMGRVNAWMFAVNLNKDRPILGGGYNTFRPRWFHVWAPEPEHFHDAHSIYFEALGEQGYPGLMIFLTLLFFNWRACGYVIREGRKREDLAWAAELALAIRLSFVAYMVGGAFLGMAYWDVIYAVIAIVVVLYHEVHQRVLADDRAEAEASLEARRRGKATEQHPQDQQPQDQQVEQSPGNQSPQRPMRGPPRRQRKSPLEAPQLGPTQTNQARKSNGESADLSGKKARPTALPPGCSKSPSPSGHGGPA